MIQDQAYPLDPIAPPPRPWLLEPISASGLHVLKELLKMASSKQMISSNDAAAAFRVLAINPSRQLAVLGRRIGMLKELLHDITSVDERLQHLVETLQAEHEQLQAVVQLNWTLNADDKEEDQA